MSDPGPDTKPRPPRRWRPLRWLLRGLTVLVLLLAGAILFLAFPPDGEPVPLPDTMRARIEAVIDDTMPAGDITIGEISVSLSRGRLMPRIRFADMRLSENGRDRVVFPVLDVELDRADLLRGQIRPRQVALGGAALQIRRGADGRFDLAFTGAQSGETRDLAQTLQGIDLMFQQPVFSRLERVTGAGLALAVQDAVTGERLRLDGADFSLVPTGEALILSVGGRMEGDAQSELSFTFTRRAAIGQTAFAASFDNLDSRELAVVSDALAWLTLVDAPLSGQLSTVLFDDATVGTLSGSLEAGAGQVVPGGGVAPQPLNALSLSFDYDAESARMWIEEFTVDAPALRARISGHATLRDGPVYLAQLQVGRIVADPPGMFEDPLTFDGGAIDLRLQLDPVVAVDFGQVVLFDEETHITASGNAAAQEAGLSLRLDAEIPELDATRVPGFWPVDRLVNTRSWLSENLRAGTITNLHAGLRLTPGAPPVYGLTFDFAGAEVQAVRHMAPVEDGRGYLDISHNVLTVVLHDGHVMAPDGGRLSLDGSVMHIEDTRERFSPASFDLQIDGPIASALTLVGAEPFTMLDQFPFDPATVARGRAELAARLAFRMEPEITVEDITFAVDGTLRDVVSTALVPGRELLADRLRLSADNESLSIGGVSRLDGVQTDATWSRAIGPDSPAASLLEGRVVLTPAALQSFGVTLPDGMLGGSGTARFTLLLAPDTPARLSLSSDLAGLSLSVPALGWSLADVETGRLTAELVLGEAPGMPVLEIAGAGLDLSGAVLLDGPGDFDRLRLDRLTVGDWLDVEGALIAQGGATRLQITGGRADLRGLPAGTDGGGGTGLPIDLRLDRLDVTDSIFLTDLNAELSGRPIGGSFRGLVGGEVPVAGSLLGEANGPALRLRAEDGGAVLRAAEIYPNAYRGELDLLLEPRPGPGNFSGRLLIDNPRLRNAPAFAELLNAISVVGLLDQLASGEGVALGDVRVAFTLSPGQVSIRNATAIGPAMGLSLEGLYDTQSRYYDFEGVVSPLYLVNGLVGGIFTPRREGLFGFTYRLSGTPEDSSVTVNPFSILTPGVFREIFRRPPPEPAR